jgi:translation initiation factor 1
VLLPIKISITDFRIANKFAQKLICREGSILKGNSEGELVYSTEHGRMCPGCGKAVAQCICNRRDSIVEGDGIVRVARQTKGRKGKGVTVITGIPLDRERLSKLAAELKSKCGCGGTVKNHTIEIQGDKRDQVISLLEPMGWKIKRSGG